MSYIESTLAKDEHVVEVFRLHRLPFIATGVWALFFLVLAAANPAVGLVGVCAMGMLAYSFKCIEQGVTNRRVVVKKGIISRDTQELRAEKVEHVNVKQGIAGRILGYGDVMVMGTGGGSLHIKTVANPLQVKTAIENALNLR
jgi:uncharacterized membrane protein YdbT with pleckstrin-like domain